MGGNLKISFKKFLLEGGNVLVGDVQAQQIDLSKIERKDIVKVVIDSLKELNKKFENKYKFPLWSKESYLTSGAVFSGSSEHFVNLNIDDNEFRKYKKSVGDIDMQVSDLYEEQLTEFLVPGIKFGRLKYLGKSETAINQISGLFEVVGYNPAINIQLDFEFVPYDKMGLPTPWAKFSHSSNWKDILEGIKGVFHKYLVGSIDFGFTENIILLKGKKRVPTKTKIHPQAFSVTRGLRKKYILAKYEDNKQIFVGKEPAYIELSSKEAKYVTDIQVIFELLFRKDSTKKELEMFDSFVGLVVLIKKNLDKKKIQAIFNEFIEKLWGKAAQKLYRNDPLKDLEQKDIAYNYFKKQVNVKANTDAIKKEYYNKY